MGQVSAKERAENDPHSAKAFGERLSTVLNDGAICLMISLGQRTGLFDVLATLPPSTSEEIAMHAELHERYVREWLGAMVTSGVVQIDADGTRFELPAEHAAVLTRDAAPDNLAVFAQYIAVLGGVEEDIVECFRRGGGVPYVRFPRFHEVMAEDSGQTLLSLLESQILPLVTGLSVRLADGIRVLDVGCGRGRILRRLAELYPRSQFMGLDLSPDAIAHAQDQAAQQGLGNAAFRTVDVSDLDRSGESEGFDLVTTFDAVHDQAQPLRVLRGIHRALKHDGVYLMQDIRASSRMRDNIDHPLGTFLYTISCMHCMTVSLAQGGEGLGAMWGEELTHEYLQRAGFRSIETHRLEHDPNNNWYVSRK